MGKGVAQQFDNPTSLQGYMFPSEAFSFILPTFFRELQWMVKVNKKTLNYWTSKRFRRLKSLYGEYI